MVEDDDLMSSSENYLGSTRHMMGTPTLTESSTSKEKDPALLQAVAERGIPPSGDNFLTRQELHIRSQRV
jgi:hypothetical protein